MHILTSSPEFVRPGSERESSWQEELKAAIRDAPELCRQLGLPAQIARQAVHGSQQFAVFVPPAFLKRMAYGDPHDPLLRQVLPEVAEREEVEGFTTDPVDDSAATLQPGVLQKYSGRALLITTGACAVHCRYCFRRHYPYQEVPHSDTAWDRAISTIESDESIEEVILSGGDPLMLVDHRLARLVSKIAAVPHVTRLRVHTRLPVMIPSRITEELLTLLGDTRLRPVVVIHSNHAQEIDADVARALSDLQRRGILLLNQAVLLRGVNDSIDAQRKLSERLVEVGVLPYYLHQMDRVQGAAHFEVPIARGKEIVAALTAQIPGYMVPKYVQEIPGEPSKTLL